MPTPQAMCIEDLFPRSELTRYTTCVAVAGAEPGLGLDKQGKVLWQKRKVTGCELWVSLDERLMLLRPQGAVPVTVRRGGRSLDVPQDKPVVLIDQDQVELGSKKFRLHFHGETEEILAPAPYPLQDTGVGRVVRATAAAVAIGMAVGGPGCGEGQPETSTGGQVEQPEPEPVTPPVTSPVTNPDTGEPKGPVVDTPDKAIEIRKRPPKKAAPKKPKDGKKQSLDDFEL
ncbi:MAG: hypothetical protein JRF63_16310 [Deltaproteobacteria bacterium]|nr:hypothetical protein [Deltaproteobacteria bacterium]